jgi:predicted ArsR family transcriptional regulator
MTSPERGARLTALQVDVLSELAAANHGRYPIAWATPLDLGAHNGSHHSGCLAALAAKGLVQFKQRSDPDNPPWGTNGRKRWRGRGSKCYRITPAGRQALSSVGEGGE